MMKQHLILVLLLGLSGAGLPACGGGNGSSNGDADVGDAGEDDSGACPLGEAGCPCAVGNECSGDLECSNGICTVGGCTPGETRCSCADGDACTVDGDECVDGVCIPRTDCTGELGCACGAGDVCDEGLTCQGGVCTRAGAVHLTLSGGDARACDVQFGSTTGFVSEVSFPAGTRGESRTRVDQTAFAVIRTTDVALAGIVASIVFADEAATAASVADLSVSCFDRSGQPASDVVPELR